MITKQAWRRMALPQEAQAVLDRAPRVVWPESVDEILPLACGGTGSQLCEVAFDVPGRGRVIEAVVARVRNGIVVNYPEPYMRRREPDCLFVADQLPTDKPRFAERFGYPFEVLRGETFDWLSTQRLAAFAFIAGQQAMGVPAIVVAPLAASFFALALAQLQGILPAQEIPAGFRPRSVIYVAPPFRHTRFDGKQVVVHNRRDGLHEMFAYNLYPGPSAKKGVYGMLIQSSESEGWITAHCSTVELVTPYDNSVTIMHEGASGGGKSEMLEQVHREPDGRLLLGRNVVTGEARYLEIPRTCEIRPVTDDMASCHPSLQDDSGYLRVTDAENGWFVRVNHITDYGTDPHLEKLTAQPPRPLVFLNIDAVPGSRALIWEHSEDAPGVRCPNARVILPRDIVPGVVNGAVTVDVRSFGVRTPPCTRDNPSYGILGLFHLLPPALGWLWRLVSPRGHSNPSIVDSEGMASEGVGSYWPFATGRMIDQANLLLKQIQSTPRVHYILCPNQHIGAWRTGFMPQWIAREYLARRGHAKYRPDQLQSARCALLGSVINQLQVEGRMIPQEFLRVHLQLEVGEEAYDRGAEMLYSFFDAQLAKFRQPDLLPLGRDIIDCFSNRGSVADYERLLGTE